MDTQRLRLIARELMDENGLQDWKFKLDRSKRRFGCCFYHEKTISISEELARLNEEKIVIDTVLHEIAHALAPANSGHNDIWKALASLLGASPELTKPEPKITATCVPCNKVFKYYRRPRASTIRGGRCPYCFSTNLEWQGLQRA